MSGRTRLFAIATASMVLVATDAAASAPRSFVASRGNDSWPCTRAQPCRSFASAIAQTVDHGEVVVVDSAGYGPVTITQSVTITAPAGVYAGVYVASGNGVTIDGVGATVVLRGLVINGQNGNLGIAMSHGDTLVVERCEITGLIGSGISVSPFAGATALVVRDTTIADLRGGPAISSAAGRLELSGVQILRNPYDGITLQGSFSIRDTVVAHNGGRGIVVDGYSSTANVPMTIERSRILSNGQTGLEMRFTTTGNSTLAIADSEIAYNNTSAIAAAGGVLVDSPVGGIGSVTLTRTTIEANGGYGLLVNQQYSYAILDDCTVVGNGNYGIATALNGATIYTRGNNVMHHNAAPYEQYGTILALGGQ